MHVGDRHVEGSKVAAHRAVAGQADPAQHLGLERGVHAHAAVRDRRPQVLRLVLLGVAWNQVHRAAGRDVQQRRVQREFSQVGLEFGGQVQPRQRLALTQLQALEQPPARAEPEVAFLPRAQAARAAGGRGTGGAAGFDLGRNQRRRHATRQRCHAR